MERDQKEIYKRLYHHAFNCYTDLLERVQDIQQELEELYLCMEEGDMERLHQLEREIEEKKTVEFIVGHMDEKTRRARVFGV